MANKMVIATLANKGCIKKTLLKTEPIWKDRFFQNVQHIIKPPEEIDKILNLPIDILFIEEDNINTFQFNYYHIFKKQNQNFKYIVLKKERSDDDIDVYKKLADDIVYFDMGEKHLSWKLISLLRRYWNSNAKSTTIIYKDLIVDFVKNVIINNDLKFEITKKESQVLLYLYENRGMYVKKGDIFYSVWGIKGEDNTRTVDQIIFKLRKKIGNKYFAAKRHHGIMFF